jgi:hypothetical protein
VPTTQTSHTKPSPGGEPIEPAPLGPEGDSCSACGAPLAADQRYCLECGERRTAARVPFTEVLAASGPTKTGPPVSPTRDWKIGRAHV